jgi:serine protease AprX
MMNQKTSVLVGLFALVFATGALAGEVLRFRTGNFQPQKMSLDGANLPLNFVDKNQTKTTRYFVVQFKQKVTESDKQSLTSKGIEVFQYLPDDAFLVRGNRDVILNLNQNGFAQVVPFAASWKVSPDFGSLNIITNNNSADILVKAVESNVRQSILDTLAGLNITAEAVGDRIIRLVAPRAMIPQIASLEGVQWIEPVSVKKLQFMKFDQIKNLNAVALAGDYSDITGIESGTQIMNFEAAWKRGFSGHGEIVAMADTGLDTGIVNTLHSDVTTVDHGYVYGLFSKSWNDPMGHGTHVSGSVIGNGKTSHGLIKGGAYDATFIPQGMWSDMAGNITPPTNISDLFLKAYNDGARVHTNSWGSSSNVYDSDAVQVDEFSFNNPEMLILFAAGNEGVDSDSDGRVDPGSLGSPGTAKNALVVGASENEVKIGGIQDKLGDLSNTWSAEPLKSDYLSDNRNGLAAFSSRGPTADGRIKPDIVAPGTNILSLRSSVKNADPLWGPYNQFYAYSGGTSMSTPLVAAASTVVRDYLEHSLMKKNPSSALVKAVLIHSATDLYPGQFGLVGLGKGQELLGHRPDANQGFGRVNMDAATSLEKLLLIDQRPGVGTGEKYESHFTVQSGKGIRVTLVYTDAPGAENSSVNLVNDLDLEVISPTGTVLTLGDSLNNVEMIEKADAAPGDYIVRVVGKSVPQGLKGKQGFALIVGSTSN